MLCSSFDLLYTGAIYLNNAGVSLFQRQQHKDQAMACFADALHLIQELSRTPSTPEGLYDINAVEIEQRLRQVSQTLAVAATNNTTARQHVHVVSEKDASSAIIAAAAPPPQEAGTTTAAAAVVVMIRLELMPTNIPDPRTYYAGLESAIILFNFGHTQTSLTSAANLFQLSYSILESLSENNNRNNTIKNNNNAIQCNDALHLLIDYTLPCGILVLTKLSETLSQLDDDDLRRADCYYYAHLVHRLQQAHAERQRNQLPLSTAGAA